MTSAIGHMIQYIYFHSLTIHVDFDVGKNGSTAGRMCNSYFGSDLLLLIKISDIRIKRRIVLKILGGVIAKINIYIYYSVAETSYIFVYLYLATVRELTVKVSQL